MTARAEAVHQKLRRRTVGRRVEKALKTFLGEWSEDYDGCQGEDVLVAVCLCPLNKLLGLYFEDLSCPSFSSLLKQVGRRNRIKELEDGLDRATEIYGGRRQFVGLLIDISGSFFVYTGDPDVEMSGLDFMRLSYQDGSRRYILSLDSLLAEIVDGNFLS